MNIIDKCLLPEQFRAVVTDDSRQPVIDCLRASWRSWDTFTRGSVKHAISTHVDISGTTHMHHALATMTNEQLSAFLYDVYDNGDLVMTESDGLVFPDDSLNVH